MVHRHRRVVQNCRTSRVMSANAGCWGMLCLCVGLTYRTVHGGSVVQCRENGRDIFMRSTNEGLRFEMVLYHIARMRV